MIRTAEPNDYAAEILIYLPLASDPRLPKLGHVFVLGEVQIKLNPGDPWTDVPVGPGGQIVERGKGWYAIRLTALQRAASTVVAYQAVCADAQPDRGTELVSSLSGDIAEGAAGVIPFFLPNFDDPVYGAPVEGHVFVLGEVELSLPDDAFGDVDPDSIVEFGGGSYGVVTTTAQAAKRGKAIVAATIDGAQRASAYRTILGEGALVPSAPPALPEPTPASAGERAAAGDLALTWSNTTGDADLSLITQSSDLTTDQGLTTALLLSLFIDRRAENDDKPPSGDPNDRRGWWGDQFLEVAGDRYGSRLWLLDRSKRTRDVVPRAKEYVLEAVNWMIEDRVVESVDFEAETTSNALLFAVGLKRPGRDRVTYRFAHTWDHMQQESA